MSGPVEIVVIIAAVGYVLARRMAGEPAQAKRMLILPAVLTVVGFTDIGKAGTSGTAVAFLVATAAVSVVLGAARGASIRLSARDGIVFLRYTWLTVGLWVLNLVVKFGANALLGATDRHTVTAAGNSLLFTLGLGLLTEGVVVLVRAVRGEGRILWARR